MVTVRILLAFVWLAVVGSGWVPQRNLLRLKHTSKPQLAEGERIMAIAKKELGVREATGRNDGKRVEAYLATVGLHKGDPYCAAFISWVFKQAGYTKPRTGWSPSLFPAKLLVKAAVPGNVFGIYFPELKRTAHCGFVEKTKDDWVFSIEGNTSIAGSREGDGVYRRMRHARTIHRIADWTIAKTN